MRSGGYSGSMHMSVRICTNAWNNSSNVQGSQPQVFTEAAVRSTTTPSSGQVNRSQHAVPTDAQQQPDSNLLQQAATMLAHEHVSHPASPKLKHGSFTQLLEADDGDVNSPRSQTQSARCHEQEAAKHKKHHRGGAYGARVPSHLIEKIKQRVLHQKEPCRPETQSLQQQPHTRQTARSSSLSSQLAQEPQPSLLAAARPRIPKPNRKASNSISHLQNQLWGRVRSSTPNISKKHKAGVLHQPPAVKHITHCTLEEAMHRLDLTNIVFKGIPKEIRPVTASPQTPAADLSWQPHLSQQLRSQLPHASCPSYVSVLQAHHLHVLHTQAAPHEAVLTPVIAPHAQFTASATAASKHDSQGADMPDTTHISLPNCNFRQAGIQPKLGRGAHEAAQTRPAEPCQPYADEALPSPSGAAQVSMLICPMEMSLSAPAHPVEGSTHGLHALQSLPEHDGRQAAMTSVAQVTPLTELLMAESPVQPHNSNSTGSKEQTKSMEAFVDNSTLVMVPPAAALPLSVVLPTSLQAPQNSTVRGEDFPMTPALQSGSSSCLQEAMPIAARRAASLPAAPLTMIPVSSAAGQISPAQMLNHDQPVDFLPADETLDSPVSHSNHVTACTEQVGFGAIIASASAVLATLNAGARHLSLNSAAHASGSLDARYTKVGIPAYPLPSAVVIYSYVSYKLVTLTYQHWSKQMTVSLLKSLLNSVSSAMVNKQASVFTKLKPSCNYAGSAVMSPCVCRLPAGSLTRHAGGT